jgi:predicted nucleotidyltransferase
MDIGLNNHLRRISSELFIKYDAEERRKINVSIDNITTRFEESFDDEISEIILFGSYTRDTILPRRFDAHSDIDILIQFNTEDYDKLTPNSYRNQLKKFAEQNYPHSIVAKDHPSIVLELNHIKFDLVPSIFDNGFFYDSVEIPNKKGGWMETEPERFKKKLTEANTRYNSVVKPIIRLLKYWNASHEYPYFSFELEIAVSEMNFNNDNYETGFLHAIKKLQSSELPEWAVRKVDMLKTTAKRINECLENEKIQKAKDQLDRILPGFLLI